MPEKKHPFIFTNVELSRAWRTQQIDHLPVQMRANKPYILFKVDLKKSEADEQVKVLKKSLIKAISIKDTRTGAHERYNVWINVKR